MCPSSIRCLSTGDDSFDEFADHSTTNWQPYWFTPSLCPGSTIAICCWPEHQSLLLTSCSGSWPLQRALWAARSSTTAAWQLTHLPHSELRWLDVADRVTYKLGATVYKCLHGQAPDYLSALCTPIAQVAERQHLHSASRHLLVVPRFSSIRTAVAPSLSLDQRHGTCSKTIYVSRTCKSTVFAYTENVSFWTVLATTRHIGRIRGVIFATMRYIKWHLLYIPLRDYY